MKSSVTKTFRKQLSELPVSVQEQAAKAYALWKEDPYHEFCSYLISNLSVGIPYLKFRVNPTGIEGKTQAYRNQKNACGTLASYL